MIQTRDDLDLDWDEVYAEAARTGTALEMNGSPHRLDLAVERARRAVEVGCLLSIDSDAHNTAELDYVRWGISQARRAWVEPPTSSTPAPAPTCSPGSPRSRQGSAVEPPAGDGRVLYHRARWTPRVVPRRDLVAGGGHVVGLSRLVDAAAPLARRRSLLVAAVMLGTLQVLGATRHHAGDCRGPDRGAADAVRRGLRGLGAIRLVPLGLWLVPAARRWWLILVDRTIAARGADRRPGTRPHGGATGRCSSSRPSSSRSSRSPASPRSCRAASRSPVRRGARSRRSRSRACCSSPASTPPSPGCSGYRASALRVTTLRDALWSAATYASAIAIGAAALRAIDIPRLIGPALLTLVFYLWDAFHGRRPSRRREPRWIWQTVVLVALGVVVVAWNLLLRA